VFQAQEERNYHIFYDLIAGCSPQEKKELGLTTPQDFRYLNQSGCFTLKNVNDVDAMKEVREAFHTLNFTKHEQNLFKAIAAVLHLGNVSFKKSDQGNMEGVEIDNASGIHSPLLLPNYQTQIHELIQMN
jgi:myosin heavy subunit